MNKFKYVLVVLVYKNIEVLRDFFQSLKLNDYKVIVVNSYYDDSSLNECKEVALKNSADFIPIDNKGFGFGNNVGTKFAMEHYDFEFLILSNSDIHVNSIRGLNTVNIEVAVIAPFTHLPDGKIQNPNIPWRIKPLFKLLKIAYFYNSSSLLFFAHVITRICRELFRLYYRMYKKSIYNIYSCHGSFIIFTKQAVEKLFPLFYDSMFLYNEELFLAENCRMKGVPIIFCPSIDVLHLEGASSCVSLGFERNKESYLTLYGWMCENNIL